MPTLVERFFDKVVLPPDPEECWMWVGSRSGGSYGYR
jgi:hypothetical protein